MTYNKSIFLSESMNRVICGLIFTLFCSAVHGQETILGWDFERDAQAGAQNMPSMVSSGIDEKASMISYGPGIKRVGSRVSWCANQWTTGNTIDKTDYFQVTITPKDGHSASISRISGYFGRGDPAGDTSQAGGGGATLFVWQYSLDQFATPGTQIGDVIEFSKTTRALISVETSDIKELQNIKAGKTLTLRFFGYAAVSATGYFRFGPNSGNDFFIEGSVSSK